MSNVLRSLVLLPFLLCLSGCGWINNWLGNDDDEAMEADEIELPAGSIVYRRPTTFYKPNQPALAISWEYDSEQNGRAVRQQRSCSIGDGSAEWDEGEQTLTCNGNQRIATNKLIEIAATDGARRVDDGRVDNQTQLVGARLFIRNAELTKIKRNTSTGAEWVEVELDEDGRPEDQ